MQHVIRDVPEGRLGGAVPGDDAAVVAGHGKHRHGALFEEQPIALLALLHALVAQLQFTRQLGHRGRVAVQRVASQVQPAQRRAAQQQTEAAEDLERAKIRVLHSVELRQPHRCRSQLQPEVLERT
jgi:hypothetical protein